MVDASLYVDNWEEIATAVKEKAGWCCENCGHHHDPGHGYTLTVHHIDDDKSNNEPWNIPALCQRCHLHYQSRLSVKQFSFFNRPPWIIRYLEAVQSISSAPKPLDHSNIPGQSQPKRLSPFLTTE